ncbi:DUF5701 family protein [Mycolicibacterium thermoresistibile]
MPINDGPTPDGPTPDGPPRVAVDLPTVRAQADRLIRLGLAEAAGLSPEQVYAAADGADGPALLVVRPDLLTASAVAPHVTVNDRPGFVVADMTDVDEFAPIAGVDLPPTPVYLLVEPDRGDAMADWSPDEALPAITGAGRTPLTLTEGLHWVLQQPDVLHRNHCFMTIGSRRRKPNGTLDARTPALWLSNGTGRDGAHRRHAPKVGWCWAGNRHTWLGFASAAGRAAVLG